MVVPAPSPRRARRPYAEAVDTTTAADRAETAWFAPAVRSIAIAMVAAGIAGAIAGGLGSRVVMRIAAMTAPERAGQLTENGNIVGQITGGGTLFLLIFAGLATTFVSGGTYLIARPWLPRRPLARGLTLGVLLLALFGPGVIEPSNADFVILGDRAQNVAMFAALFVLAGLLLVGVERFLERLVPHRGPERPLVGLLTAETVIAAFAVLAVVLSVFALGSTFGMDELIPAVTRGGAAATLLGLGLGRAFARGRGAFRAERALTVTGYVTLAVMVAAAASVTWDAITTIV